MAGGIFRVPPPTFVGGAQPYAPKLGISQSGPVPQAPPVRTLAVLGIIASTWAAPSYALPPQTRIAPLIPATAVADNPPYSRASLAIIDRAWRTDQRLPIVGENFAPLVPIASNPPPSSRASRERIDAAWRFDPVTVIALASSAPTLAATSDSPPPSRSRAYLNVDAAWRVDTLVQLPLASFAAQAEAPAADLPPSDDTRLNVVLRAWQPAPPYVRVRLPAPASGPVADSPPPLYRPTFNATIALWRPPWYDPQELIGIGAVLQAPVVPDTPPVRTLTTLQSIVKQWPIGWDIPPALELLVPPPPDRAPLPGRVNHNAILDQWKPFVVPELVDKLAAILYVPPLTPDSDVRVSFDAIGWDDGFFQVR